MEPKYAHSTHYLGSGGEEYFRWQRASGEVGGAISARMFRKYIQEDDCVLDFGCGGGYLLKNLSCERRIGVEINPAARQAAIENGVECYSNLSELPGQLMDVVISSHALEHVPAPLEVLTELCRLLRPNGLLVLLLPIDDWRTQRRIDPSDINHHLYTWTPQLMFNCLGEAGFNKKGIQVSVYTHAWFPGFGKVFKFAPEFIFDAGCTLFAMLRNRRQLFAVASKC